MTRIAVNPGRFAATGPGYRMPITRLVKTVIVRSESFLGRRDDDVIAYSARGYDPLCVFRRVIRPRDRSATKYRRNRNHGQLTCRQLHAISVFAWLYLFAHEDYSIFRGGTGKFPSYDRVTVSCELQFQLYDRNRRNHNSSLQLWQSSLCQDLRYRARYFISTAINLRINFL